MKRQPEHDCFSTDPADAGPRSTAITIVTEQEFPSWALALDPIRQGQLAAAQFSGKRGQLATLVDERGIVSDVILALPSDAEIMRTFSDAVARLPAGLYRVASEPGEDHLFRAAIGWAHGSYSFSLGEPKVTSQSRRLILDRRFDKARVQVVSSGANLLRRLVDTPSNLMGPTELVAEAGKLADRYGARCTVVGDSELQRMYPLVHAVGRSSQRQPYLFDLRWGNEKHFKLTLVGKGVCFDSGGLNLKTTEHIRYMKRDMAGAAIMLSIAHVIMARRMPICLRVLVPCVDNSVSERSLQPSDVIASRAGKAIEIANTDAEGRLVLADAIYEGDLEEPDLLVDCGSLTGSSRSVLGPDFGVIITASESIARDLVAAGMQAEDPLWSLPLWPHYRSWLKSDTADLMNTTNGLGMAGPIIAALFLSEFVSMAKAWVHLDVPGWNVTSRFGRPLGGEPTAFYALERFLDTRFSSDRAS